MDLSFALKDMVFLLGFAVVICCVFWGFTRI